MALLSFPLHGKYSVFFPTTVAGKFPDHHALPPQNLVGTTVKASRKTEDIIVRQSANYHSPIWSDEFIQSLNNKFKEKTCRRQFNQLKGQVMRLLKEKNDSLEQLELIDILQRLGISYHFKREIKDILKKIYNKRYEDARTKNNLYATSLEFRLLRQHGLNISEEVFNVFKDETGNFKTFFHKDTNGMVSLYEASFLSVKGENLLDEARCFTVNYLKEYVKSSEDELEANIVSHILKIPFHWKIPRLEAKRSIDMYQKKVNINPILIEMAKLDFNMLQSIYQEDLKYASSWWRNTKLGEKLSFARDQLMENFFWTIGMGFEHELEHFRRMGTKVIALITIIDDVYDVYGTLDELKLFTRTIERWDIDSMNELPEYMKECFFTIYNLVNEIASQALRDQGVNVMQHLKKTWVDLCKSYLLEATWYHIGYKPTLEEYMNNAWISVAGPIMLVHSYVFITPRIANEDLESLIEYADIIRWSSTIMRLANDLLTPLDQNVGDVPKSIQCCMNDMGVSENIARENIRQMIDELWKKLNGIEDENLVFPPAFIEMTKNLARMAQFMYQYGDGHTIDQNKTKDHVVSLLVEPIMIVV